MTEMLRCQCEFHVRSIDSHRKSGWMLTAMDNARHQIWHEAYEKLADGKHYIVHVNERWEDGLDPAFREPVKRFVIEIEFTASAYKYQYISMVPPQYERMSFRVLSQSATEEHKQGEKNPDLKPIP